MLLDRQVFYTIYQITNKINGKIYIGKHQTINLNDTYMGSGKMLMRAIKKYGLENFEKKILFIFDTETEMNSKEKELVTEEFCESKCNYNLNPGGKGGFGYINQNELSVRNITKNNGKVLSVLANDRKNRLLQDVESDWSKSYRSKLSNNLKGKPSRFLGKRHTDDTKKKMSESHKNKHVGTKNSQFGTLWITNGKQSRKISNTESIPNGWYRGRKIK